MEKIGDIIRKYRVQRGMTQEELGDKVFVTKQAVSKWETGKTIPDIETIRLLCDILQINKDEILGRSIAETKNNRKWLKALCVVSAICVLISSFFCLGGPDYIKRHTQSGVAYLTVFYSGDLVSADEYRVEGLNQTEDRDNGYKFDIDYGEIRGKAYLFDKLEIEFGFVNTNNWHSVHIRIDIEENDGQYVVKQTISYETDASYQVTENEKTTTENEISVFQAGV